MRLFLQDGPARLQILSRSHVREFRDVAIAREFLRPLLAQAGNRTAIWTALALESRISGAPAVGDHDLVDYLARRIVSEGLQVISCADSHLTAIQGTFTEAAAAAAEAEAAPAATTTPLQDEEAAAAEAAKEPEEKHWIEIELLDDDGKPVANEAYLIELPDGSKVTGRTDGEGRARLVNIDPGTAKVSFPDLEKDAHPKQ